MTGRKTLLTTATALSLMGVGSGTAVADYNYYESDALTYQSGDAKAKAKGHINWYHGDFPQGYIHRGDYGSNAKVYATRRVGCIWAKVSYGFPTGSLTIGSGTGGSVSGGSYEGNGYYRSCRRKGKRRPKRLSLYGVGYAKALLNSSTLEICTSASKRQGPRFCSFEKNVYGGD